MPPLPPLWGPADKQFQNTGLDRVAAIDKDLAWFQEKYGIAAPQVGSGWGAQGGGGEGASAPVRGQRAGGPGRCGCEGAAWG